MKRTRHKILAALLAAAALAAVVVVAAPTTGAHQGSTDPGLTVQVTQQADGRYATDLRDGTTEVAQALTGPTDEVTVGAASSDLTGHGLSEDLSVIPHGGDPRTAAQIDAEQQTWLTNHAAGRATTTRSATTRPVRSKVVHLSRQHGALTFTPGHLLAPAPTATTRGMSSIGTIPTASGCIGFSWHSTLGGCYRRNALGGDAHYNYSYDQSQGSGHGAHGWTLNVAALRHSYVHDGHNQVIQWAPGADLSGNHCVTDTFSLGFAGAGASISAPRCSDGYRVLRETSYFRNEWHGESRTSTIGVAALDLIKVNRAYNSHFRFYLTQGVCYYFIRCGWETK